MKKKNLIVKVLSLSLTLLLLAGCGSNPASTGGEAPGSDGENATGGTYMISLSSHQSSSSVHHYTVAEFKSRVEERTGGAVTVNLFEDAQLGNERDNIEGVQMGTIQMCLADTGYVANLLKDYNILQLPFIFREL